MTRPPNVRTEDQRLTPFQRDYLRMADALHVSLSSVGAADEALTRRIVAADRGASERVSVHSSDISDPTGNEAGRRAAALERREQYRDTAIMAIWNAIKTAQRATDAVLRHEPSITPAGAQVCSTQDCDNFASPHQHPETEAVIGDLCDTCWRNICPLCYMRQRPDYRQACDACRKRIERQGEAA